MSKAAWPGNPIWTVWQKIFFRFFIIYFVLFVASYPWIWSENIPWSDKPLRYFYQFMEWSMNMVNNKILHLYESIPFYGGGDTSSGWVQLYISILIALTVCIFWSLLDRKRSNYNLLAYWFRILLRYTLIFNCFSYGFNKMFLFQMPFPSFSQMSTPLGDYLPMRLSWLTMGYSGTYQFFAGIIEVFAGILLLFRRTATFGTIVSLGVFINVMMMNIGYDIGVKTFSIHLVIMCIILLAFEYKRIMALVFNKTMPAGNIYFVSYSKLWKRTLAIFGKLIMIVLMVILPLKQHYTWFKDAKQSKQIGQIKPGVYEVKTFVLNKDTISLSYSDSLRWKDVIIDNISEGSIGTNDTMFRQRYGRGYFKFAVDSTKHNIDIINRTADFKTIPLGKMHFEFPDSNTVVLAGVLRKDSIYAILVRTNRHFRLAENKIHWRMDFRP